MFKNLLIDVVGRRKDNFDWRCRMPSLNLESIETVCVLHHNDKTGDAILISLLVDALAKERTGLKLYVGSPSSFVTYWQSHPSVTEAIPIDAHKGSFVQRGIRGWAAGRSLRGRFDVVVSFQPFARPELFALIRALKPRVAIGFNKDPYRLFDYSLEEHRHGVDLSLIATRARSVMRLFGREVDVNALRPHLPFAEKDVQLARTMLAGFFPDGRRVLVNTYGAGREKRLSPSSTQRIIEEVRSLSPLTSVLVSVPCDEEQAYRAPLDKACIDRVEVIGPRKDLASRCALVDAVDAVISPDTSVGHIAAALGKPQVCLFSRKGSAAEIWRPMNIRCTVLVPESGESVNDIDWAEFGERLAEMLDSLHSTPVHA